MSPSTRIDPADWNFSGPTDAVPSMVGGPPGSAPRYPRHLGYRQPSVGGSGCLAAAVATLVGLRAPLVAAVMGERPDVAAATRAVELWSGEHTLAYWERPLEWTPRAGKLILVYRAGSGAGRHRDEGPARDPESGRFMSQPVHAAVVHGDDASLYCDPHAETWTEPEPENVIGYLQVVSAITLPSYLERTTA